MSSHGDSDQGVVEESDPVGHYRLAYLLKRAQTLLVERYGPALAPYDIDGRELAVLSALARYGPISQQQVSREFAIDRTTVVALVDALERKGLVQRRTPAHDRRKNMVELTDQGDQVFRRANPAIDEVERRFLEPLAAGEVEALKAVLRTLLSAAPDRGPDPSPSRS